MRMSDDTPLLSLLIPTRNRTDCLRQFLSSLTATTERPSDIEVVLGIDADDEESRHVTFENLTIRHVVLPPGLTMGQMNRACYAGSSGRFVMLMNDDVIVRTAGWDRQVRQVVEAFDDEIVLVHVNDGIFGEKLCTFPMVSRTMAELAGAICPDVYERYRIDDHTYGIFNLLAVLGHKRLVYLPEVLFEHLNFEQRGVGDREYKYHSATLDRDAARFDELMPERKRAAVALAQHIDRHGASVRDRANEAALAPLTDSYALRRPEYVTVVSPSRPIAARERPLVTVVSGDIRREHAQRCLDQLKTHTSNCDLLIVDNCGDPGFNHARVMNELIDSARSRWVVLLDDDVFVEQGWLEGLIRAAEEPGVGVVTPLHNGRNGRLSYSGVVIPVGLNGEHSHSLDRPQAVRDTPTICSAAMLIDMSRCGHLRFDARYLKYFHDLDYGLQAWEAGARVVVTPDVTVTHVGGGTLAQGSDSALLQWERDGGAFAHAWMQTGRLARLRENRWTRSPYIDAVYSIVDDLERALLSDAFPTDEAWKRAIRDVLDLAATIPIWGRVVADHVRRWSERTEPSRPPWYDYRLRYLRYKATGETYNEDAEPLRLALDPIVDRWIEARTRVVVYGAGVHTEQLFRFTRLLRAPLVGIVDSNSRLHGTTVWGLPVLAPARIAEFRPGAVVISSKAFQNEIASGLSDLLPAWIERLLLYGPDGSVRCAESRQEIAS
jgi:glycosyltransferase involved in cell wall biosynthesis